MKNLKKLGKLKLMPEKLLNQNELLSFRGGSGGGGGCSGAPGTNICQNCLASAECGCFTSCGNDTNCYSNCIVSQSSQCMSMYGCYDHGTGSWGCNC